MGLLAKIQTFLYSTRTNGSAVGDVKADPGGGANITGELFQSPGFDAQPLAGDIALIVQVPGTGRGAVAGTLDPKNAQSTGPGGIRIYARTESGEQVSEIHLQNDGSINITTTDAKTVTISNGSASFSMSGDEIDLNGVKIDNSGKITANDLETTTATIGGIEQTTHTHAITSAPGTSGPPQAGTP